MSIAATKNEKRKVGRPRALTREQIVEAALRLGLDSFSMKAVSAELGVTIATLYKYVQDRDHLFRLAVGEALASTHIPEDRGQHWADYIEEFTGAIILRFAADRQIVDLLVQSGVGLETELRLGLVFIGALVRRGFDATEAARILQLVSIVTFGVAVRFHCDAARARQHGSRRQAMDEAVRLLDEEEMALARAIPMADRENPLSLLKLSLAPILAQVAAARGETLPPV